ncbi:MAG: hypothetical protein NC181_01250 [Clostridium sp.]|nr:hypothetical protein [Clostridium sp.]MCM1443996.1 hypothetical protein [Candidatus Amulumruptor caecigallinarius]
MDKLNEILKELGISKVKLAKFLGVSRQMIYNYLELEDINKWPKDKKVLLLNLLGIKSTEEIENIKVNTDYIMEVEARINSLFENTKSKEISENGIYDGLGKKERELLGNIIDVVKEKLEDSTDNADINSYYSMKYLYNFIQSMDTSKELKYILAYIAKAAGFEKPMQFQFEEEEQFVFESILFSAFTIFNNGGYSKTKISECHKRFVAQIEHKMEEKMSRTMELNSFKTQALKELGYTEITQNNAVEVFEKMAEIESRKITN